MAVGLCIHIVYTNIMNNEEVKKEKKSYKIRTLRCSDKTWESFKQMRWKSCGSWEKFLKSLIDKKQ